MIIGAWNVRTLLDREDTARPHRRTALIARELARYKIDIAALSETRFAEEGAICEPEGGTPSSGKEEQRMKTDNTELDLPSATHYCDNFLTSLLASMRG